eukprot:PLAT8865.1.p2 GENE.PLAT8865.1~~PLAT8865.1.p2  ORF type:complete len:103 (-),score=21.99 PLAT8865.1:108-416(-)
MADLPSGGLAAVVPDNVKLHFQAVGGAPILRKKKFRVRSDEKFARVITWLRKQLSLKPDAPLFVYCSSAFAPSPDETLGPLYACFQSGNELKLQYGLTGAWG